MNQELINKLIDIAKEMSQKNFCCQHSKFTVGTALLTESGNIYGGFNIENDGIQSICGERSAFVKALTAGEKKFKAIVVVGKNLSDPKFTKTLPCGYCRQFMSEYAHPDFIIYAYDEIENKIYTYTLKELLPESFKL